MMVVALAIEALLPAAEYGGSTAENTQEAYDALRWEDSRLKPTWSQIEVAWVALQPTMVDEDSELKIENEIHRDQRDRAISKLIIDGELSQDYRNKR